MIRRLLEWGGRPAILDEITLPAGLFRGLTRARLEAFPGSMYGFFEASFGVRMLQAKEKVKAVAAPAVAARLLKVRPGTPLLQIDRVATTFGRHAGNGESKLNGSSGVGCAKAGMPGTGPAVTGSPVSGSASLGSPGMTSPVHGSPVTGSSTSGSPATGSPISGSP